MLSKTTPKYTLPQRLVYYNDAADLLDRLELLGVILTGNNGAKNEFSQIVHTLNKLVVLNKNQLKDVLKEHII